MQESEGISSRPTEHPAKLTQFSIRELHDRPLSGKPHEAVPWHWKLYGCELIATAVLMIVGILTNTLILAPASPLSDVLKQHPGLQTALCGLFFGLGATCAAMTPFGKTSGAHLSPSVSLAFALGGRLAPRDMLGYFVAQITGACIGTLAIYSTGLLTPGWGGWMSSIHYAATLPAPQLSPIPVIGAELCATAGLIFMLLFLAAHSEFNRFAIWMPGLYYFCANPLIAWISGDSTNFARSLGPALMAGNFRGLWIYAVSPVMGAALAILLLRSGLFGKIRLIEARLVNFGHHGRVPRFSAPTMTGPHPKDVEGSKSH